MEQQEEGISMNLAGPQAKWSRVNSQVWFLC